MRVDERRQTNNRQGEAARGWLAEAAFLTAFTRSPLISVSIYLPTCF
jgi:hypothetical protein